MKTCWFLDEYMQYAGTSEVPPMFHRWAALAALAACASDHVYIQKFATKNLAPNLYIYLIGPSGLGKGEAIDTALRLLHGVNVRVLRGRITAAYMIDALSAKTNTGVAGPSHSGQREAKLLLVTPELSMAVGRGTQADDLVKLMTELYSGNDWSPLVEGTRTSGRHVIKNHCVSWLAGTTKEWLRDCVTVDAVQGGFFARTACIVADYNLDRRIARPMVSTDYDALVGRLQAHLHDVIDTKGVYTLEPQAELLLDDWYLTRPAPTDETLLPSWKREHDLVLKLSLLLALGDPPLDGVVYARHVIAAQKLAAEAARAVPQLIEYVALTQETDGLRRVRETIMGAGAIKHTALARAMARFGITRDKLMLFIETLEEGRSIGRMRGGRGQDTYVWKGRRKLPQEDPA